MKSITKFFVLLAFCVWFGGTARATVVSALYTFDSNTGVSTDTDPNSTAGTLTLNGYGPGTKFDKNHIALAGGGIDIQGSQDASKYVAFTVSFTSAVNLSSFTFNLASDKNGKVVDWAIRSSVDSYAANIGSGSTTSTTASQQTVNFSTLNNVSAVTFRLYFWNGTSGAGATVDDVTLDTLNTSAVPEPVNTALAMFGGMAVVFGGVRIYRRKKSASPV